MVLGQERVTSGHVMMVVDVPGDGSVIVWDSNWAAPHQVAKRRVTNLYGLRGYIYAKDSDDPPIWGGDTTPPVVNFSHRNPTGRWYRSSEVVYWHITDEGGSGVRGFGQSWVGDPAYQYGGPDGWLELSWAGEGLWSAHVRAWDNAGNNALCTCGWFGYDISVPTAALVSGSPGHWYNYAATVTWAGSDSLSGIRSASYRWNSGDAWTAGTQPTVPEGKHTLEVLVEDNTWYDTTQYGNVGVYSLGEFWRDTGLPAPSEPAFDIPSPAGAAASIVTVTASATDTLSGVAKLEVIADGIVVGTVAGGSGTVPWAVSSLLPGAHTVKVRATDNAGNQATTPGTTYTIDRTPPTTTASLSGTAGLGGWYVSPVTVTLTPADDSSGVRSTRYTLDGGAEQTYTAPFTVQDDGRHAVAFWSSDATNPAPGNREETRGVEVPVDMTPPEPPAVLDDGAVTDDPSVLNGQWSGSDPASGIAAYQYAVTDDPGAPDSALTWSVAFPASGTSGFFQAPSLRLVPGPTYYLRARLQNGAGAWGIGGQSDGITVSGTVLPNRLRPGLFASAGATEDGGPPLGSLGEPAVCTLDGNANGLPGDLLTQPEGLGYLWAGFWQHAQAIGADLIALEPSAVVGGETVRVTVYLAQPAPLGGAIVAIGTDDPSALPSLPSQVTVAEGETSVSFETPTAARTAGSVVRIYAVYATTVAADLHVRAYHSMTFVIDRTGTVGEVAILRAYVYGLPGREKLAGRSVAFQVEGTAVGSAVTNADGRADLLWVITPGATRRTLLDTFAGDMDYAPSSGSATLTSIVWATKMVGLDRSGRITDRVQLKAILFRSDNTRLPGKLITFSVEGTPVGSDMTDSEGRAEWYYTIPDGAGAGDRGVLAVWAGDGGYLPKSVTTTLHVSPARPYIWVLSRTVPQGAGANLYAYFRRLNDYQKQAGKTVDFRIGGTVVQTVVTDANGVARYLYPTTEPPGAYTIRCEFAGDAWVDAGYGEAKLTIY